MLLKQSEAKQLFDLSGDYTDFYIIPTSDGLQKHTFNHREFPHFWHWFSGSIFRFGQRSAGWRLIWIKLCAACRTNWRSFCVKQHNVTSLPSNNSFQIISDGTLNCTTLRHQCLSLHYVRQEIWVMLSGTRNYFRHELHVRGKRAEDEASKEKWKKKKRK